MTNLRVDFVVVGNFNARDLTQAINIEPSHIEPRVKKGLFGLNQVVSEQERWEWHGEERTLIYHQLNGAILKTLQRFEPELTTLLDFKQKYQLGFLVYCTYTEGKPPEQVWLSSTVLQLLARFEADVEVSQYN